MHLRLSHSTEGDTEEARQARRDHVEQNVRDYAGLLGRACPAGVYEYVDQPETKEGEKLKVEDEGWGGKKLVINSQVRASWYSRRHRLLIVLLPELHPLQAM